MKILELVPNLNIGGAQKVAVDISIELAKRGHKVFLVSLFAPKNNHLTDALQESNVQVLGLNKKPGPDFSMILKLFKILNKLNVDVIHTHTDALKYSLLPKLIFRKIVGIHTIHTKPSFENRGVKKYISKIAYTLCNFTPVVIAKAMMDEFKSVHPKINAEYIINGIELPKVSAKIIEKQKNKKPQFINVAGMRPAKNQKMLIDVFSQLCAHYPDVELIMVGDGPLLSNLKKITNTMKLSKNIRFLGYRKDVLNLLYNSHLFCLTSTREGVPLSVIEAMATGNVVIASNVGGIPDLIDNGISGILIEPNNKSKMLRCMQKLVENSEYRLKLAEAGVFRSRQFSIVKTVDSYERLMKKHLCID